MSSRVYGVSLGPGDPDLITVKGLKKLREADIIFYPSTIKGGKRVSFSSKILDAYNLDNQELVGIDIPMSRDRELVTREYKKLCSRVIELYNEGKNVVFVAEGDVSFYSTFVYIIEGLNESDIPFEMIPGVPAFIAAGSLSLKPLVVQNQKLLVLPAPESEEEVNRAVEVADTVVIMKLSFFKRGLYSYLEQFKGEFFYCEKVGTDDEFSTTELSSLEGRAVPYFSMLLLKKI